jgi:hypothetical protein
MGRMELDERPMDWSAAAETLVAFGAPLAAFRAHVRQPLEQALVTGLLRASTDATVLRSLPVVLARNWRHLDWTQLEEKARAVQVLETLGMLVELTADLAHLPDLRSRAERWWAPHAQAKPFFRRRNTFDAELAEERTPRVARKWGFLMNLGEDSFRSLLERHVGKV